MSQKTSKTTLDGCVALLTSWFSNPRRIVSLRGVWFQPSIPFEVKLQMDGTTPEKATFWVSDSMKLMKFDKVCMYVHVVSQSETNSRCCFLPQPFGLFGLVGGWRPDKTESYPCWWLKSCKSWDVKIKHSLPSLLELFESWDFHQTFKHQAYRDRSLFLLATQMVAEFFHRLAAVEWLPYDR